MSTATTPGTRLPFDGLTVLVTGTITGLTRDQAKEAVTALGGTPASGVTRTTDLVVLGDGAGHSKTAKARSLGLPVLSGETFAALAADPTAWDGTPVGLTFADYDTQHAPAEPAEPATRPDPAHWIARAVVHVSGPDGTITQQVRLGCACGHKRMRTSLWGDDTCPRPQNPTHGAPWETPAR